MYFFFGLICYYTLNLNYIDECFWLKFTTVWQKSLPETGLSGVCVENGLIFFTVNDIEDARNSQMNNNPGKERNRWVKHQKVTAKDLDGNFQMGKLNLMEGK